MSDANPQQLRLLPKLVIGLAALLIVAGVLWYGITMEVVFRILRNLINRLRDHHWGSHCDHRNRRDRRR